MSGWREYVSKLTVALQNRYMGRYRHGKDRRNILKDRENMMEMSEKLDTGLLEMRKRGWIRNYKSGCHNRKSRNIWERDYKENYGNQEDSGKEEEEADARESLQKRMQKLGLDINKEIGIDELRRMSKYN